MNLDELTDEWIDSGQYSAQDVMDLRDMLRAQVQLLRIYGWQHDESLQMFLHRHKTESRWKPASEVKRGKPDTWATLIVAGIEDDRLVAGVAHYFTNYNRAGDRWRLPKTWKRSTLPLWVIEPPEALAPNAKED